MYEGSKYNCINAARWGVCVWITWIGMNTLLFFLENTHVARHFSWCQGAINCFQNQPQNPSFISDVKKESWIPFVVPREWKNGFYSNTKSVNQAKEAGLWRMSFLTSSLETSPGLFLIQQRERGKGGRGDHTADEATEQDLDPGSIKIPGHSHPLSQI